MRQIAATRRRDRLQQQIASCDMWKSLSLRSVARIQTAIDRDPLFTGTIGRKFSNSVDQSERA